ncbi:MAG: glycosyltransferase [Candidatus Woesearchaeota archaeon]
MTKLSIIFTTNHADTLGNANRLEMAKFLSRHFKTTVFTNQFEFINKHFPHCEVKQLETKKGKLPFISDVFYWKSIAKEINSIDCDAVFMAYSTSPVAIWLNKPVFQYIHQYGRRSKKSGNILKELKRSFSEWFSEWFFFGGMKNSKINFAVSQLIIDFFRKKGVPNLVLNPHAMDINKYQQPLLTQEHDYLKKLKEEEYFIAAYTGWTTIDRGFYLMLDAIRYATEEDKKVILAIAGADDEFTQKIKSYTMQYKLENNIVNFGVVDVSIIPGILHYADVCISFWDKLPGHIYAPPQKVIEYFAAGKPVLCNDIQTHELYVTNGINGLLLNYDAKVLADTLLKLKNNPEKLKTMSQNALEEAYKYDINNVYGNMVKRINEQLNEHKN